MKELLLQGNLALGFEPLVCSESRDAVLFFLLGQYLPPEHPSREVILRYQTFMLRAFNKRLGQNPASNFLPYYVSADLNEYMRPFGLWT